ncbi:MAG: efflux RND transporter periplasmic adaptor subunit [Labilithrix sp.]|nr:efflux RND transporter periplasmic adaptor subunit [Labilithrix sp.]
MPFFDWTGKRGRACARIHWGLALGAATVGCRGKAPPPASFDPRVTVAVVRSSEVGRTVRLSGTLEADRTLPLGFAQPGTVEAVLVQEGESVKRGQALARLVTRSLSDALGVAEAKAAQADDAVRRLEPLRRNGTLPEIQWVEAETGRQQARLVVSMAQKNLDDATLRAPEDGVVSRRHVEAGASVLPGAPAITLVKTRRMLAVAPIAETQIAHVQIGQPARVTVSATGKSFQGAVREIGVLADPLTRTYPVKIALDNADGALRVGMVADVYLQQRDGESALVVPPAAVRIDEHGGTYVYVVTSDDKARREPVQITGFVGEDTALTGRIVAGARVVTSGTPMLTDGIAVRVANDGKAAVAP